MRPVKPAMFHTACAILSCECDFKEILPPPESTQRSKLEGLLYSESLALLWVLRADVVFVTVLSLTS